MRGKAATGRTRRAGSESSSSSKRQRRRQKRRELQNRLLKRTISSDPRRLRWLHMRNQGITAVPSDPGKETRWLPSFRVVSASLVEVRLASLQMRSPGLRTSDT